ncbi:hypothetical protein SAMN03097699_3390 [Flavobacteriaceae bacterium MAR_2010_188]|nr:hypothetical protein SAMN03097699_3390 [Flavobacteriaceae bacterium MAR_2010_188]
MDRYKLYELTFVRSNPDYVPVSPEQKEFCDFIITQRSENQTN